MNTKNTYNEGRVTEMIEDKTAAVPSTAFLVAALAAMGVSLTLNVLKSHIPLYLWANGLRHFYYWAFTTK